MQQCRTWLFFRHWLKYQGTPIVLGNLQFLFPIAIRYKHENRSLIWVGYTGVFNKL